MWNSLVFYFAENVCALFDHHGTDRQTFSVYDPLNSIATSADLVGGPK